MTDPAPIEVDLPGARVAFSTRLGGVSQRPYRSLNLGILSDDKPTRVSENRRRLAATVGLDAERVAMGLQVHGTDLATWSQAPGPDSAYAVHRRTAGATPLAEVDDHVTDLPGLGLLVLAADCLPVALAAPGRVAMVHCGWRGLAGGILDRAVACFDERPVAAIGPGIGRCCYEVGADVLAAFEGFDGVAAGRMLDLRAVARTELAAAGVHEVEDVDLCTCCREDLFFSHRRDAGVTGRQGGLAWRTA